ncbi:MAG: hypothetical protein UU69_C0008G0017 [Candidatus Magasanikbacteria bacterium GW2011_GWA2_41_55]|uniref:Fibronectin type-III domain-containing protein n=1 Tax=Candidatus Magasanikbacteria bacterium GW2011_GWA2_41_55 TaxID=1619038 RepID=A0A0G0WML9_9BACT|nr:MAG: hypothetical protein UU69_C0008G0017 [Candidatus Magasanikbacteria bacterium GW2011_GWA2_41_55]
MKRLVFGIIVIILGVSAVGGVFNELKILGVKEVTTHLRLKVSKEKILKHWTEDGVKKYEYVSDVEVSTNGAELTKNSIVHRKGIDEKGKEIFEAKVFSADTFVQEISTKKWYEIEYATSTEASFNEQLALNWWEKIKNLVVSPVYADTMTFYPDADPEVATVDGHAWRSTAAETWANKIGGAGTSNSSVATTHRAIYIDSSATENAWDLNYRTILLFDTSSAPDNAIIDSATISLKVTEAVDTLGITPDYVIVSSTPASNTALANGDYNQLGSTPFSDVLAYGTFTVGQWATSTLNAAGIADISLTSISKFGLRNSNYDLAAIAPAWSSNVYSRVTVNSADNIGTASDPFLTIVYHQNTIPTATAITPVQTSGTIVTLSTAVADANNDATSLILEYSTDNSTWASSTLATVTPSEGAVTTATGLISGIDTNLDGSVDLNIQWNAGTDINNTDDSTVYFRIIPNDGTANGSTQTSAAFAVDTLVPTAPGNLGISTTSTQGVIFSFGSQTSETNFVEYKIFYKAGSSGVAITDTAMTSSTYSSLGSKTYSGETTIALTGLATSTQYVAKIWAYDTFGNLTPSSGEISFYTLATAPGTPTVTASTTLSTALKIVLNQATNPSGVTYGICKTTNGTSCASNSYLQADGTLGASAVWQSYTTWGGATGQDIIGLTANTSYQFLTQASNGDNYTTSLSTANSATYTLANAVTSFSVSNTSVTSTLQLQLSWTNNSQTGMKMERDNGCDGTYDATLYDSTSANDSSPTSTSSNLTANTCYQFKISSYNGSGVVNSNSVATTSQITTPPGQPQNVTTSNIDTTEITWTWDAVTGATSYGVYNNSTGALLSTVTGATSYLQSPLSLNTSYSIVVRAVNTNGTGIASSAATAVTGVDAPTGITAAAGGKTASSITWSWTDGGQSGFYARNKNLTTQNSDWIVTNSWNQTDLSANTSYTVQVKAKNSSGTNTAYTEASAYSAQNAPSGITFSSVTATGITATVDGTFTNNGIASSLIHFSNGAGSTQDVTSGASWANSGLTPNTNYTYTVYATNGNGDQTTSVSDSKYSLANTPGTITTSVGSSATTLVLTLSANSNPTNTNVVIYSSSTSQYVNSTTEELTGTSSSYDTFANWGTVTVNGLTPNTSYQFLAVAKNGANVLTASSTASAALYTLAATPTGFSTVVDSSSQITTSWAANSNPTGTEFYVEVVGDSSKNSGWITGTSYAFTGLTQGTNYSFKVKARNGNGVTTDWLTSSTATTQSSGGGGAVAVAAPVIIPTVIAEINSTPVTVKVDGSITSLSNHAVSSGGVVNAVFSTNSAVSMVVDDVKHTIVLNGIKNNVAKFTAYSSPQSFEVKQGEEKIIDLNNDGHADLHILVKKILSAEKKADVTMTVLDDLTFTINDNMSFVTSSLITLRLKSIPNVEMISFSENKNFVGASFFPYTEFSIFKLSPGAGLKTVYARLRTKQGGTADVSDTITLLSDESAVADNLNAMPTEIVAAPKKSSTTKYIFKNYLYLGSRGMEVRQLQMKLKELGFFTYPKITGIFGSATKAAVVKFQKANKLKPYPGWVGKGTREVLNQQ